MRLTHVEVKTPAGNIASVSMNLEKFEADEKFRKAIYAVIDAATAQLWRGEE